MVVVNGQAQGQQVALTLQRVAMVPVHPERVRHTVRQTPTLTQGQAAVRHVQQTIRTAVILRRPTRVAQAV